jgi:hypothetical protein
MHTIGIAIWIADAAAILYGGYHYWAFFQKFEQARMAGKIPISLQAPRMGIIWMIASPGRGARWGYSPTKGNVRIGCFRRLVARFHGLCQFCWPPKFVGRLKIE